MPCRSIYLTFTNSFITKVEYTIYQHSTLTNLLLQKLNITYIGIINLIKINHAFVEFVNRNSSFVAAYSQNKFC